MVVLSFPSYANFSAGKRYKMIRTLASGAQGDIWLCEVLDPELEALAKGKYLVAKIVKEDSERSRKLFFQEVSVSYHLREHPNIAKTIGYSEQPKAILMRYYEYGSLAECIQRPASVGCANDGGPPFQWTTEWKWLLLSDIACGVQEIHRQSIIHGDLKPLNILLANNETRGRMTAVITDFRIAKVMSDKTNLAAGYERSRVQGLSRQYAAPETIRNFHQSVFEKDPSVLKAGDVYSVAIITIELIKLKHPWNAKDHAVPQ